MNETVLRNARIVTADDCFAGHLRLRDGLIVDVARGDTAVPGALDLEGDLLLPGLVEVHTDNLEKHMLPRPGVHWDPYSATVVHDAQCAAAGITTVLDAVVVGSRDLGGVRNRMQETAIATLQRCREHGVLRVEHLLHLRCEVATADVLEHFAKHVDRRDLRLVSVMDHTAGQRQWRDLAKYRQYMERNGRYTEDAFTEMLADQQHEHHAYASRHRRAVVAGARERGVPVASHDDTEVEHIAEAHGEGITMSEFPTTVHAARAAREAGQRAFVCSKLRAPSTRARKAISLRHTHTHTLCSEARPHTTLPTSLACCVCVRVSPLPATRDPNRSRDRPALLHLTLRDTARSARASSHRARANLRAVQREGGWARGRSGSSIRIKT